jgi:stage II sporulation protein M
MDFNNIFKIDIKIKFYIKALALLLVISGVFGFITAQQFPLEAGVALGEVAKELSFIEELDSASIFLLIALNNSIKAFIMMLLGILWGVVPVIFILLNGYAIGIVLSVVMVQTSFISVVLGTLPHGIFEIPAILLAASYGIWLGEMFVKKLKKKKSVLKIHVRNVIGKFMKVIFPMLIVAAFIETFITSWIIGMFIS